jgi:hypothetical protein
MGSHQRAQAMKIIRILSPGCIVLALALAGCGSAAVHAASTSGGPDASAPNAYLATGSGWVNYIQWDSSGTGSLTEDILTGSAPDETVNSNQTPITVSVNGSQVDFTGLTPQFGTLANGTLTLQVLGSDGTLGTDTFTPASQADFNTAAGALQSQAASDNGAALQQQAQASTASANAAAEQQAQSDLSNVQSAGDFTSDLASLSSDVTQANSDLGQLKSDAAQGPDGSGNSPGSCVNVSSTVYNDADSTLYNDQQSSLDNDVNSLAGAIQIARGDISTLNADLSSLSSSGLPAPAGAQAAISAAQQAIRQAIASANSDIAQVNQDVVVGFQIANGLATGACAGDGPGAPPSPIPPLS